MFNKAIHAHFTEREFVHEQLNVRSTLCQNVCSKYYWKPYECVIQHFNILEINPQLCK